MNRCFLPAGYKNIVHLRAFVCGSVHQCYLALGLGARLWDAYGLPLLKYG